MDRFQRAPERRVPTSCRFGSMWQPRAVLCVIALAIAGCMAPEERAAQFIQRGEDQLAAGELIKARLEFQNALQIDGKLAPAWLGLARVAELQADWPQAYSFISRVVDIEPGNLQAQLMRGRLLLAAGQLDEALTLSNLTQELAPDSAPMLALRAAVFYKLDDPEEAVALAEMALEKSPDSLDALVVLATERLDAGDPAAAISFLDRGIAKDEANAALRLIKIEALNRLDMAEDAEAVFRRLIALYPEADVFRHRLAAFYLERYREDEAEAIYREIAAARPHDSDAQMNVVRFMNTVRGSAAAIAEVERYISEAPDDTAMRFVLARLQRAGGDPSGAEATLRDMTESVSSAEARNRARSELAAFLLERGDMDAGMALVDEVLAEDPRNEQAVVLKSTQRIEARELDAAVSDLRYVLKDNPNSARVLLLLGKAHELQGAADLADDLYSRAFAASGRSAEFALPYARFLLGLRRVDRARSALEEALRGNPHHHGALTTLAQIYVARGEWTKAQSIADRISALDDPGQIGQQIRGAALAGRREYDESINVLRQAYQAASSPERPMASLVSTYVSAGKVSEAHDFLNSVLAVNERNTTALLLRGQVFAMQAKWDEAEELLRRVTEFEPAQVVAWQSLAAIHLRQQAVDEALDVINEAIRANPGDFGLRLSRASVLEAGKEYDEAIAEYEALLAQRPNADVVANNLASLLTDHRNDEASLRRALQLATRFRGSNVPHFKDTLGWTFYRLGNAEDARDLIADATQQVPEFPIFRYHLGMAHLAANDRESARRELETALQLTSEQDLALRSSIESAIGTL